MKDYWHIIAFSAVIAMLTLQTSYFILLLLFLLWLAYLYLFKRIKLIPLLLTLLSICFFLYHLPSTKELHTSVANPEQFSSAISGDIISTVTQTAQKIEFTLQEVKTNEKMIIVYFWNEMEDEHDKIGFLLHGATCHLTGEVMIPNGERNPYQFDYQDYLLKKGIKYQLILTDINDISCNGQSILQNVYGFKDMIINQTNEKLSNETRGWLYALVLGDDSLLSVEVIELFQRWGISHILAISGLHIGIVVGLVYLVLIRLNLTTKEKAQWVIVFLLPLYALLAGGQPSVWRASSMVLLLIILNKLKLKYNYTDIVSIIFILLIIFNKYIFFHIGFQLSFAVTFGLILSNRWIMQSETNLERLLQISFVSQMMILPLQLYYFGTFQPLSILLNIIVVPFFSVFVIPFMFILLILIKFPSIILHSIENVFIIVQDWFLTGLFWLDEHLSFQFIIGDFPFVFSIIYYVIFVLLMINLEIRKEKTAFKYGALLIAVICLLAIRPYLSPVGTVTMLDIGQGDAFVVELPYRKGVFLIDAGMPVSFPVTNESDKVYKQVIKPYLYGRGIQHIDTVFLSHEHIDHFGSLKFIIDDFPVDEIIISNLYELTTEYEEIWTSKGAEITRVEFNEQIDRRGQNFHVVSPYRDRLDANENSLALFTELGGLRWLFTGDIGKETEADIIRNYAQLQVDVLKVGHHGSDTSTNPLFIEQINPTYSLIPVGLNNMYRLPSTEVIETLESEQIIVYRSDLDGAVQYHFRNNGGLFTTFLKRK